MQDNSGYILQSKLHSVKLSAKYIPGKKNILADQVPLTEWSLFPRMFDAICEVLEWPLIDLFATRANAKLPLYMSPVPDPMAWRQDTFHHPGDSLHAYAFPPFVLLLKVLSPVRHSKWLFLLLTTTL